MGYWDEFDKADKEESSGSGGIVGNVIVDTGFKVYAAGHSNEETFFPTGGVGSDARLAAKRKAEAFAQENDASKPKWAVQIRVEKDGAFSGGQPATWENDRFFVTDTWTDAFKKVVRPALEQFDIVLPYTGWARVGFKNDPYFEAMGEEGKTDRDQDGNPRFKLVAYITELFASKDEAMVAVAAGGGEAEVGFVPLEWEAEDWAGVVVDIKAKEGSMNKVQLCNYVKETYDVELTIADLIQVLK